MAQNDKLTQTNPHVQKKVPWIISRELTHKTTVHQQPQNKQKQKIAKTER